MKGQLMNGIKRFVVLGLQSMALALITQGTAYAIGGTMPGSGTAIDPYLVEDYADLKAVGTTYGLSAVYRLMADIDASASASENSGAGFVPIGNSSTKFTGKFHGAGHLISNLYINRPTTTYVGLFGYASGATIDSLGLAGGSISGYGTVGSLSGYLISSGAVSDCHSSCQVTGGYYHVGGLIGLVDQSTVSRCHSTGTVSDTLSFVGGLIGTIDNYGSVTESFATGSVSGGGCVGGLLGYNIRYSTVNKCYATGPVTLVRSSAVGGLVGYNKTYATISQSYSTGLVTGSAYVGGLVGWNSVSTVNSSYWNIISSGMAVGVGYNESFSTFSATGLTTVAMRQLSSFSGWDFSGVWNIRADSTYPGLRALDNAPFAFNDTLTSDRSFPLSNLLANDFDVETAGSALVVHVISTSAGTTDSATTLTFPAGIPNGTVATVKYRVGEVLFSDTLWGNIASSQLTLVTLDGGGTEGDPFLVANYTDLKTVGTNATYNLEAVYRVVADIDASASASENSGAGFTPIGTSAARFTGMFHGSGHNITNLTINRPATDYVGLFGYVSDLFSATSMIDSLGLVDGAITGRNLVGGIAGWADQNSILSQCFNTGSVAGASQVGGIAGETFDADINHCWNEGNISSSSTVGGLLGAVSYSSVNYCHNTGSVSSSGYTAGGILGNDHGGNITNCYNTGGIFAASGTAGGIAGSSLATGTIGNCYNTGMIASQNSVGGIVGHNGAFNTISNCYNGGGISGTVFVGGVAGYQEFNGTIANSYWDTQASGQSLACGDNSEGGTITAVAGLPTIEMKDPVNLTNLDFVSNWAIRADSTYPSLRGLDNAPFAFAETLASDTLVALSRLLSNDCDFETMQAGLMLHVEYVSAGTTDSAFTLMLPGTTPHGTIVTIKYRIAEIRTSDTLWGNVATSYIYVDKQAPLAVNLASPADGGYVKDSLAAFAWHPAIDDFGVEYYQMQCASDTGFIVNLRDTTVADTTVNLMLPAPDAIYFWRARAVDACGNIGPYSPIWQFDIDVTSPAIPALLSPIDDYWTEDSTIICSWGEVVKMAKAADVSYIIQLDTSNTFAFPLIEDTTAILSDTFNLSEGQYYWRVMAFDLAGNYGTYSGYRSFGVDTTAPDIQYVSSLLDDPSAPYGPYEVTSKVYDLSGVKSSWFFTQVNGWAWDSTAMFFASDSLRDTIPELVPVTDETLSVSYYIKAIDMLDHETISSTYSFRAIGPLGVTGNPGASLPAVYALTGAYPNPSRGQTTFKYQLPKETKVKLEIYNVAGQLIKTFDQGTKPAGYHAINWNSTASNGVYIYRLRAGSFMASGKLILLR